MKRAGKKRLYIEVPFDVFEDILECMQRYRLNITSWVTLAIIEKINREK